MVDEAPHDPLLVPNFTLPPTVQYTLSTIILVSIECTAAACDAHVSSVAVPISIIDKEQTLFDLVLRLDFDFQL